MKGFLDFLFAISSLTTSLWCLMYFVFMTTRTNFHVCFKAFSWLFMTVKIHLLTKSYKIPWLLYNTPLYTFLLLLIKSSEISWQLTTEERNLLKERIHVFFLTLTIFFNIFDIVYLNFTINSDLNEFRNWMNSAQKRSFLFF